MNQMYYNKRQILEIFENQYRPLVESGKFNFDINWNGFNFSGPTLVRSTKNYYLHQIAYPITSCIYWIKVINGVYYRFDVQQNGCHNLFHLNRSKSKAPELSDEEKEEFLNFLTETEQFQGIIFLMSCICKLGTIKSVIGGIFDNVLSPLLNEDGNLTLHIHKSYEEEITTKDNVLHLSLF